MPETELNFNEKIEERLSKLEKDKESIFRFFVQYLLAPILAVLIGIYFNTKIETDKIIVNKTIENDRKLINQIKLAQSMLTTLFSDDPFKTLATSKLLNQILENEKLKEEINKLVKDHLELKTKKMVQLGNMSSAIDIINSVKQIDNSSVSQDFIAKLESYLVPSQEELKNAKIGIGDNNPVVVLKPVQEYVIYDTEKLKKMLSDFEKLNPSRHDYVLTWNPINSYLN